MKIATAIQLFLSIALVVIFCLAYLPVTGSIADETAPIEEPAEMQTTQEVAVEKLQDLGEFHALWSINDGTGVRLVVTGGPESTAVGLRFAGIQSVNVVEDTADMADHTMWLIIVALRLQPDRVCQVIIGNSPASTASFECPIG